AERQVLLRGLFFQAEDVIRDFHVTGVQTCALPIWPSPTTGDTPSKRIRGRYRCPLRTCTKFSGLSTSTTVSFRTWTSSSSPTYCVTSQGWAPAVASFWVPPPGSGLRAKSGPSTPCCTNWATTFTFAISDHIFRCR